MVMTAGDDRSSRPIHPFPYGCDVNIYPLKKALCGVQSDIKAFAFSARKKCLGVLGIYFIYLIKYTSLSFFENVMQLGRRCERSPFYLFIILSRFISVVAGTGR